MSGLNEEGYVWRKIETMEKLKIPEGSVKCPICEGSGEVRKYYGQPGDKGQFMICFECMGKGFISKEIFEELRKWGKIRG